MILQLFIILISKYKFEMNEQPSQQCDAHGGSKSYWRATAPDSHVLVGVKVAGCLMGLSHQKRQMPTAQIPIREPSQSMFFITINNSFISNKWL